jgi:G3E family GTPase
VQGQLVDGLKELYFKRLAGHIPAFERLAIETTGLADPLPIINCILRNPLFKQIYDLDTVITTVDGVYGQSQLDLHEEAVRQAAIADHILITKSDLASAESMVGLRERLHKLNPTARISLTHFGRISPVELFGIRFFDLQQKSIDVRTWLEQDAQGLPRGGQHHDHHPQHNHSEGPHSGDHAPVDVNRHNVHISSFCLTIDDPIPWGSFEDWYIDLAEKHGDDLLRVKGILNVAGESRPSFLHCVQSILHEPTPLTSWPDEDHRSRIVFITRDLSRDQVESGLRAHLAKVSGMKCAGSSPPATARSHPAQRWLNQAELSHLFAALVGQNDRVAADALRLMLLTGVVADDICAADWEEIDLKRRIWLKRVRHKSARGFNDGPRRIPLPDPACTLLGSLRLLGSGSGPVFHSGASLKSRMEETWAIAMRKANVEELPLSALPPTLAIDLFVGLAPSLTRALLGMEPTETAPVNSPTKAALGNRR